MKIGKSEKTEKTLKSLKPKKKTQNRGLSKKYGRTTWFTFDFGRYSLKVAVAKVSGDKIDVKELFEVECARDDSLPLQPFDPSEWKKKISKAFLKHKISASKNPAFCTIGPDYYIGRMIELPYINENDLAGMASYELSRILSLDIDNYYYQHRLIRTYERDGVKMCSVWVAAVLKGYCDNIKTLMESLRLKPVVLDVDVNCAERLIRTTDASSAEKAIAFLDMGQQRTSLHVFIKDLYAGSFPIGRGSREIVNAVKAHYGSASYSATNPDKLIISPRQVYGILKSIDSSQTAAAFSSEVEFWIRDISDAITRFKMENPLDTIDEIVIAGGNDQLIWMMKYLEKYLEIPIRIVDLPANVRLSVSGNDKKPARMRYHNALSLLLVD